MSNNPFKPPDTDVNGKPPARGPALRAVLTGLAVDIGGSTLASLLLGLFYHAQLAANGMTSDQIDEAIQNLHSDSPIAIIGMVVGSGCSVLGGYVCARVARRDEYRFGGMMAALSALFGLVFGSDDTPDDLVMLFTLTTVACVLLGVKYGREHNRRSTQTPPPGSPRDASRP